MSVENGQRTLASLFTDNILRVPQFQRAYAWEREPHLRNFIEDIRNHPTAPDKRYFFGTILLTSAPDIQVPLFSTYDIVDGQQRLTTASIFVAAAIPVLQNDPNNCEIAADYQERFVRKRDVRKFRTITEDDSFFDRFILGNEVGSDDNCETPSQKRLLEAKRYFASFLANVTAAEIIRLINTLWESQILVYAVNSNVEATQIFELQNDRGKRLTDLEALKSFLMHGLYLHGGNGTESDLSAVQSNFAAIYRRVEKLEGKYGSPNEDQILTYHCIAFEDHVILEDKSNGWEHPKQLVRHVLEKSDKSSRSTWIKNLSNRLRDSYDTAVQILDARDTYKCIPLGDLEALERTASYWPLLLKCWRLDANTTTKTNFSKAVSAMASFSFRSIIASKRSDTGESELRRLAQSFSGDYESLTNRLNELRNEWDIPEYFELGLNSENFFEWGKVATYLLWKYENHLRSKTGKQVPRLQWDTIVLPASTAVKYAKDHIEPKDPANPTLARQVKWSPNDERTRPFSEVFLHRLGNLVLDTYSTGSAKGNRDFSSRIYHYTNSGFLSQGEVVSLFASKDAAGNVVWDEVSIKKRHEALVDYAKTHM